MLAVPNYIAYKMTIKRISCKRPFPTFDKRQFKTTQTSNSKNDGKTFKKIAPFWAQKLLNMIF